MEPEHSRDLCGMNYSRYAKIYLVNFSPETLEEALSVLGAVLEDRELEYSILAVGGGSLMLLGLIGRATKDLDIVAIKESGGYSKADPLPGPLLRAVEDTGRALGLPPDWINAGPAGLFDFGLPEGFESRLKVRRFGALELWLLERRDQIALKLYAAVDQGPQSKHTADLRLLEPTAEELLEAARWTRQHDPSRGFHGELIRALKHFGVEVNEVGLQ